jgi:hypothetical protein
MVNDRIEGHPTDGGGWIEAPGAPPAGLSEILVEYDGLNVYTYWGMHHMVELHTTYGAYFRLEDVTAKHNHGDQLALTAYYRIPEEPSGLFLDIDTGPFTYGEHHYRLAIRDGYAIWNVTDADGNAVFTDVQSDMPGFLLQDIAKFEFFVNTTTDNNTWADNLTVTCVR